LKIKVQPLGLPTLSELIGKKAEFDLAGETIEDLVSVIVQKYGLRARQLLLNDEGEVDLIIQVIINDEGFLQRDDFAKRHLKDGDVIKFLLLAGGG
jgi:molybdopterin converting factor small subunit